MKFLIKLSVASALFAVLILATSIVAQAASITTSKLEVCAKENGGCKQSAKTYFTIPSSGKYNVVANIGRGARPPQCQAHEDFDIYIDDVFYAANVDPNPCEGVHRVYKNYNFPSINLSTGTHKLKMYHRWMLQPSTGTPESVSVSLTFSTPETPPQPERPTCSMSANPTSIIRGNSSTLNWSSTNTTSVSINQGIGNVGTGGTRSVSPNSTTTYTGTFTGAGGTTTCSATVAVSSQPNPNAPTCSMNANPANIGKGESSTLSWSSTNTTSVSINQGIGSVTTSGTRNVSPNSTTTYTGTFTGAGGTTTCSATVAVNGSPEPEPEPDKNCKGEIGDLIWMDSNGNGIKDENEKGIDGVQVKLTKGGKTYRDKTNADGHYKFDNLCKGNYTVSVSDDDVAGLIQTYDPDDTKNNKTDVRLDNDRESFMKADFGYKGKKVAPKTGSGSIAILVSFLLTIITFAAYKKIKHKKLALKK